METPPAVNLIIRSWRIIQSYYQLVPAPVTPPEKPEAPPSPSEGPKLIPATQTVSQIDNPLIPGSCTSGWGRTATADGVGSRLSPGLNRQKCRDKVSSEGVPHLSCPDGRPVVYVVL